MRRTKEWWAALTSDERRELVGLEREKWASYERRKTLTHKANLAIAAKIGGRYCPVCGERDWLEHPEWYPEPQCGCGHVFTEEELACAKTSL